MHIGSAWLFAPLSHAEFAGFVVTANSLRERYPCYVPHHPTSFALLFPGSTRDPHFSDHQQPGSPHSNSLASVLAHTRR